MPCRKNPLEKSGLEPAAPNRLADRKHCALSTHPNVHINILRGLPCRLESLRLKFTNEPSIFVDGDLDESIRRSASDRLGDLVPQVRARTSPGVFRDMALPGLCLELSFKKKIKALRPKMTKIASRGPALRNHAVLGYVLSVISLFDMRQFAQGYNEWPKP